MWEPDTSGCWLRRDCGLLRPVHKAFREIISIGHSPEDSWEDSAICWDLKDAVERERQKASWRGHVRDFPELGDGMGWVFNDL